MANLFFARVIVALLLADGVVVLSSACLLMVGFFGRYAELVAWLTLAAVGSLFALAAMICLFGKEPASASPLDVLEN